VKWAAFNRGAFSGGEATAAGDRADPGTRLGGRIRIGGAILKIWPKKMKKMHEIFFNKKRCM